MTKKESFIKAINYQKSFPVPYVIRFTVEAEEQYRKFLGGSFDEILDTGSYTAFSQTTIGWEEVRPGYYKDCFGIVWNKTKDRTLGIVDDYPLKNPA